MRKFISWNIDSLNAALTSDSPRAQLSRDVLSTLKEEDADFIAIQETKLPPGGPARKHTKALEEYFPGYQVEWVSSVPPARKGYAGTMILYKEGMTIEKTVPEIGAPQPMDQEGRLLVLESDAFYFANVYTPNAGDGLKRLGDRQVWDKWTGKSPSSPAGTSMSPIRRSTWPIRRATTCRRASQTRSGRASLTCWAEALSTPSAMYTGM